MATHTPTDGWPNDDANEHEPDHDEERCDYCGTIVEDTEAVTRVGSSVYHGWPSCYLRKLLAIRS